MCFSTFVLHYLVFFLCLFYEVVPEVYLVLQGLWQEQLWRILLFCCHTFWLYKFIVRALRCFDCDFCSFWCSIKLMPAVRHVAVK